MERTDKNIVKRAVPNRPDNANKGTMGTLLSICGSFGMAGAAILAGKSALRCGVGLEKLAIPKSIYPIAAGSILESVFLPLSETSDGKISRTRITTQFGGRTVTQGHTCQHHCSRLDRHPHVP